LSSLNGGIFERFESPRITCGFLILICQSLAFLLLLICLSGSCNGVCLNELPLRLSLLTRQPGWSDGDGGCGTGDDIGVSARCCTDVKRPSPWIGVRRRETRPSRERERRRIEPLLTRSVRITHDLTHAHC